MTENKITPLDSVEEIVAQIDDNTKLLRLVDVEQIVGFKSTHIYNMIKSGKFPRPIRFSRRHVVWTTNQITAWKKESVRSALAGR